ncbi:hypothetical protein [Marinobacter sp. W-8]|uniref:hypothetical protein n=1 Tax=Marinobacter sp. W-8 TaxID=3369658 RepID=UPI0037C9EFDB
MIRFTSISDANIWSGVDWTITDEDEVAGLVARVALGQSRHATKIISSLSSILPPPPETAKEGAIRLLTAKDLEKPYHRDGWLFQVLTWIAAHLHRSQTLKSSPHMIHAHKGFDGLELRVNEDLTSVSSVIICEQKATENPRNKITSQVWPEFVSLESGERDNELVAEVTTILARNGSIDADEAVAAILWNQSRSYCVSVTVDDEHNSEAGRKALFGGYDKKIPNGNVDRRGAETFFKPELRAWMESLAQKAIKVVNDMDVTHV